MKREEYLDLLRYYLRSLPNGIIQDIISDYDNHFIDAMAKGRSEDEISMELGSPKEIADEYLNNERFRVNRESNMNSEQFYNENNTKRLLSGKSILRAILMIFLIIIFGPLIFGVITALIATVFGIGIALFSLVFAVFIVGISIMIPGGILLGTGAGFISILNPITRICLSLGIIGLSIILLNLAFRFVRFILREIRKGIQMFRWRFNKWRKRI